MLDVSSRCIFDVEKNDVSMLDTYLHANFAHFYTLDAFRWKFSFSNGK